MKYCTACKAKYDDSVSFCAVDGEVLALGANTIGKMRVGPMIGATELPAVGID